MPSIPKISSDPKDLAVHNHAPVPHPKSITLLCGTGQGGVGHINEQPQEYWIELFQQYGYDYIDVRKYFQADGGVEQWYREKWDSLKKK